MMARKTSSKLTGNPEVDEQIAHLIAGWKLGEQEAGFNELVASIYRLSQQNLTSGEMKLFLHSLGEMRYAQKVFAPYRGIRKICIFGSARTSPSLPIYQSAYQFAHLMEEAGFMVITGAGEGIMGAAQRGAGKAKSFGLNILLPFEQHPNEEIQGDPKLMTFRYFFTRKLTFLRETSAIALFPGGFGTMDEGFEALTLLQTGKARLFPIVLIDEPNGKFWIEFVDYLKNHLLKNKLVSAQDFNLFKITSSLEEAREEIINFYRVFHSYRFVGPDLIIRLQRSVSDLLIQSLNKQFAGLLLPAGQIEPCSALPQEQNEPELAHLPRLKIAFDRMQYGQLRELINCLNAS